MQNDHKIDKKRDINSHAFYTESNRKAWNAAMPKHQEKMKKDWDHRFLSPGFFVQKDPELKYLKEVGFEGKDIAHLSCNNGIELMSLKNLGARKCIGFDISDRAIDEAKERVKLTGIECEFIKTDVLEIGDDFYDQFDLIYVTIGALCWIPSLDRYFEKAAKLLRKGRKVFLYESHPFTDVFPWEDEGENNLKAVNPYFTNEIYEDDNGIDYIGGTTYKSPKSYEFMHTMSDIIMALVKNGINIKLFKEFRHDISMCKGHLMDEKVSLPMSYILMGEKNDVKKIPKKQEEINGEKY